MSGNNLGANEEFDEQLRMQELYGDTKDGDTRGDLGEEPDSLGQQAADTPYEWDLDKKAWFPKITEDFIATYQANYGFSNDGASTSTANTQDISARPAEDPVQIKTPEPTDSRKKGEKRKSEPGWFHVEEDRNTNVYVSGLPPDITVDEFIQLMSKFGIIMRDPQTEEFKVKLYKDNQGNLKGDGLCCYLKRESVELALKLLDEDEIRGYKLHVEVAKFQLKGEYDASKKKKKCKDYKKKLSLQQKQLDWRPERRAGPSRMRHERVVIIKNMFHPMDFEDDPLVLNEIREDLRVECSKFGQIKKLLLFDRHPDGVASVSFRDPEEADYCIQTLDGRWFGGRQITAEAWDGTTDYQVEETSREREERLRGWEAFLNAPEANRGLQRSNSVVASDGAGPSRVRHFSEHPSTSQMNVEESATKMALEEPIDEKFEKTEDGGGFEEDAAENDANGGGPGKEGEEDDESSPERECEEGSPLQERAESSPKEELKENGPKRESQKRFRNDDEEKSAVEEPEDDEPHEDSEEGDDSEKESEEDQSQEHSHDGSEKELGGSGVERNFDEEGSEQEFHDNVPYTELQENDTDRSDFDEGSERVLGEDGSERECEDSEEKEEEEPYEKVFDDESDEKEDEEVDGKEPESAETKEGETNAEGKFFEDSDEKEEDEDTDVKGDGGVEDKLFEDDDSNEKLFDDENSNEKFFDDSDEKGTLGGFENVKEEGTLSTGSSFVLSSDEDDDI
ncbi:HIV Tat-specific factor 1 [Ochotona princeps]|uniref:HIV Tat-specific factor 1 n=1 Tax=Ochotona princeps TaxID=9978 RepID=UPI0027154288|nr:HIV Tat-specific factor 1 [Ochotona princeps]XP_058514558.1 HIV Tat-specific factor 1 [Ochotona princeps]